jgi:hypothetical protein
VKSNDGREKAHKLSAVNYNKVGTNLNCSFSSINNGIAVLMILIICRTDVEY